MKWIEILGPSGIGKSVFLNSLMTYRGDDCKWITTEEAKLKWAILNMDKNDTVSKIMKFYLNQNFISSKKNDIAEILINRKKAFIKEGHNFEEFIISYIDFHLHQTSAYKDKSYRISLFHRIIENLCLHKNLEIRETLVMDEGPISHHPDIYKVRWMNQKIRPSGIIMCHLSVKSNLKRIYQRKKDGRLAPLHQGMTDKELLLHVEEKHDKYLNKCEILKHSNIPFLEINLEQPTNAERTAAHNFIMKTI